MDDMYSESSSSEDGLSMEQVHHPSFFQLYLPEHNSAKLRIPPPFIKNFKGNIPEKISLQNTYGRVWPAKLSYIDNKLHITHGWHRYVNDRKLQCGDFVVLRYQHNTTFLVMAYGLDGMLKHEPRLKKICANPGDRRCTDVNYTEFGSMMFYKTFKSKFKNFVDLPKYITDRCTISLPQTVMLTNDGGRGIRIRLCKVTNRVGLGYAGLRSFWRKNGAEDGDELEFEVICGVQNKIEQVIVRNKTRCNLFGRGY